MKATEQYFPVVLFIMLYKVVLTMTPWMIPNVTIHMKLLGKLLKFTVVLSIMMK